MRVFRAGLPLWSATALMAAFLCVGAHTALAQSQDYDRLVVQFNQMVASGQLLQAEGVAKRLQGVARDRFGAGSRQYAEALALLGDAYLEQRKNADAEKTYRDALAIHKKRLGASNPENIIYLSQLILSVIRQNTRGANKTAEFEHLANELHGLLEQGKIPSTGIVALGLMETGRALYGFRLYEQAIYFLERAQHLYRAFNPTDPSSLLATTHYLGLSYRQIGNLTDGERQLKDALATADAIRDADGKARVEHDLANVLVQQGRKDEAIRLYEAALRTGGGTGIKTKGNLALLYAERGRFAEAERLLREQMELLQNESPRNEQDIVETRANTIAVLGLSGKVNEAIPLIKENMLLAERTKDVYLLVISKMALAGAYNDINRHDESLALLRQLRADEASQRKGFEDLFASFRSSIGQQLLAAGSPREAYDVLREAVVSGTQRYNTLVPDTRSAEKIRGAQSKRSVDGSETLVAAAFALAAIEPSRSLPLLLEAFEAAQWSTVGEAGLAIAQLSARAAGPNAALSVQARSLQELTGTWRLLDERLLEVRRDPGVSTNPAEEITQLTGEIKQIEGKLSTAARTISQQYPGYWALARPQPVSLAKVRELLRDDEVLILFDVQYGRTFAWAVTKQQDPQWQRIDSSELADTIEALRCGLDETLWRLDGTVDCSKLVGREPFKEKVGQVDQNVLPFDLGRAYKLYSSLLAPFASQLRTTDGKARHLLLVLSGPLTSLPFNVLVTEPLATPILSSLLAYRGVAWLGSRQAITVLPSVASLVTLGRAAGDSRAAKPYLGIGNPLLDGQQDDPKDGAFYKARAQAVRDKQQCPNSAPPRPPVVVASAHQAGWFARLFRGGAGDIADIEEVRLWTPLPETADELCDVARRLGVPESEILLGLRATETALKSLSERGELKQYRVLHFATHGALTRQVQASAEPGLILTPPPKGTTDNAKLKRDDGFLTTSEIAALDLDADWVILSACNTAGGANETAEPLSGMARAFIFAGARALLVSHWEVNSEATVKLITQTFAELRSDSTIGRAEALRRSMVHLINNGTLVDAHPSVWAPFVLVGKGGRP